MFSSGLFRKIRLNPLAARLKAWMKMTRNLLFFWFDRADRGFGKASAHGDEQANDLRRILANLILEQNGMIWLRGHAEAVEDAANWISKIWLKRSERGLLLICCRQIPSTTLNSTDIPRTRAPYSAPSTNFTTTIRTAIAGANAVFRTSRSAMTQFGSDNHLRPDGQTNSQKSQVSTKFRSRLIANRLAMVGLPCVRNFKRKSYKKASNKRIRLSPHSWRNA